MYIRRPRMIEGSCFPISHLVGLLAYGRHVAKAEGQAGLVVWDEDNMDLTIKDIYVKVSHFREFTKGAAKSIEGLLYGEVVFGITPPRVDLQ